MPRLKKLTLYEFVEQAKEDGLTAEECDQAYEEYLDEYYDALAELHQRWVDEYYEESSLGWHQQDIIDMYRREK